MKVIRRLDEKRNVIFEADRIEIYIDVEKLRKASGILISLFHRDYNKFTRKVFPFGTKGQVIYEDEGGTLSIDDEGFLRVCDGVVILPIKSILRWRKSSYSIRKTVLKLLAHEVAHLFNKDLGKGKWWSIFKYRLIFPLEVLILVYISLLVLAELRFVIVSGIVFSFFKCFLVSSSGLLLLITAFHMLASKERKVYKFTKRALKSPEWLEVVKVSRR